MIRTQYTPNQMTFEPSSSETLTVPDQSLTVKDILRRFTAGSLNPSEIHRPGQYDDSPDIDNPVTPFEDLTDAQFAMQRGHEVLRDFKAPESPLAVADPSANAVKPEGPATAAAVPAQP